MAQCCGYVAAASYRVNFVTEASRGGGVACFGRCRACEVSQLITSAHGTVRKRAGVPSGCCGWAAFRQAAPNESAAWAVYRVRFPADSFA